MATYVYDPSIGDYIPEPDERDTIEEKMKKEEASLVLPISSGRMYMGPSMSPEEEAAFRRTAPGTSINLMPPPSGPPPTSLERLQAQDIPGQTQTLSLSENVPMPVPEDPGAAKFAMIQEYQRMRNAGVPESEAVSRVGLDYFMPQGRYGRLTPYQELSTGLRERQINLAEQSQKERLAREARKEESVISPGVSARYKALVSTEQQAAEGLDPAVANRARWAREQFELEHPELISKPRVVAPPASAGSPKVGEVRKGYRFKGGNPNSKSNWEKIGR